MSYMHYDQGNNLNSPELIGKKTNECTVGKHQGKPLWIDNIIMPKKKKDQEVIDFHNGDSLWVNDSQLHALSVLVTIYYHMRYKLLYT